MARCGCGGAGSGGTCNCVLVDGNGTTVTGTGASTSPNQVNIKVDPVAGNLVKLGPNGLAVACEDVQDCVGGALDQGLVYDDAGNKIRVRLSTQGGNTIVYGPDGGLYATPGAVSLGCGLEAGPGGTIQVNAGDFSAIQVKTCGGLVGPSGSAPIACPDTAGSTVYCGADGVLRGIPEKFTVTRSSSLNEGYSPGPALPFMTSETSLTVTNPSNCYCMCGLVSFGAIVFESSTGNSQPEMFYQVDVGDGVFQEFGVRMRDTRGISSLSQERTRFVAPINVCVAPGATSTFRYRVRWAYGPVHAGGTTQILAAAREIRFAGSNL